MSRRLWLELMGWVARAGVWLHPLWIAGTSLLLDPSPEASLSLALSHFHLYPMPSSPLSSCRIKQPALKLHANKDTACKPCHMAQLASVCGSDGHTYSSVVRTPRPTGMGMGCT